MQSRKQSIRSRRSSIDSADLTPKTSANALVDDIPDFRGAQAHSSNHSMLTRAGAKIMRDRWLSLDKNELMSASARIAARMEQSDFEMVQSLSECEHCEGPRANSSFSTCTPSTCSFVLNAAQGNRTPFASPDGEQRGGLG
jgi:hypothetical protein